MEDRGARDTGRLAVAVGAVAFASAACLLTFEVVRGPFGTINDIGNATTGVLSAALAWRLRRQISGRAGDIAQGAATVGAAITVIGSALVVSGTTGFFLAGLVSSVGFAGIGAWVVVASRTFVGPEWTPRLRTLGVVAGALMAFGILAVPGILLRLDDMETAPALIWIAFLGWFGTFVVYPAWAILMGRVELRQASQLQSLSSDEGVPSWTGG